MLRWRLISAAVILTVLFALLWLDYRLALAFTPGIALLPLLILVSLLATEELLGLLRAQGHQPIATLAYLGNTAIPLTAAWPVYMVLVGYPTWIKLEWYESIGASTAVLAMLVLVGEIIRFKHPGNSITNAAISIFVLVYVGLLISFWALLRLHGANERGMVALISMLLIVKMADTGAFVTGKLIGRHKMTPILSPGKTWEGTVGGFAVACLTSCYFFHYAAPRLVPGDYREPELTALLAYGLVLAIAGMIGDLAESLIKRDVDQKDSSTWLRGLGGVLDIIDAPLVAGPVAWLFWKSGWLG